MQASPTQRWGEVIDDHRLPATFRLGSFTGVIDDERIEMGDGIQDELRPAVPAQSNALAWKPLSAAVLADMDQHLCAMALPEPVVLRQVAMRRRQIR